VCEGRPQVRTELWLDSETHLILRQATPYGVMEVRAIDYAPVFADGTFLFTPPAGARDANAAAADPYTQTSLRKSEIAPLWSGPLLDGSPFRLSDAQGKPLLILLWAAWCPRGDPACDVLRQYDEISQRYAGRAGFVSVDIGGQREEARKIVDALGFRFPVVVDEDRQVERTWGVKSIPTWVLLDRDGRVVEVRLKPQTVEQLQEMLRGVGL
jgi:peroxiredoxin